MTNTFGVDVRVSEEQQQAFKDVFAPAMATLLARLGYFPDYEYDEGRVSMTIRGPFESAIDYCKHRAGEQAA